MLGIERTPLKRKNTKQVVAKGDLPAGVPSAEVSDDPVTDALLADTHILPPEKDIVDAWGDDDKYDAIGDSGAGGAIGSIEALQAQGANPDQIKKLVRELQNPVQFKTAAGVVPSTAAIDVKT